jgi:DsbC/DsbD-like thiol-disulfide interchange protein
MTGLVVVAMAMSLLAGPVETPHLSIVPVSVITAKGLDLHLDVRTRPGWHVYASGNPGYFPLTIEIDAQEGAVTGSVVFPKPEVFLFRMSEEVRVFRGEFRVTLPIRLSPDLRARLRKPGARLTGRVSYQACTDDACSLKTTKEIAWTP